MYKDKKAILLLAVIQLFIHFRLQAQAEKIYLDLDKYACRSGETVWFKAYVTEGLALSPISTNLYVNVYSKSGQILSQQIFPIDRGRSKGQVLFRDTIPSDNYYIVAFTKEQLNYDSTHLFSIPVLVYNKEKPAAIHYQKATGEDGAVTAGPVKDITWISNVVKGSLTCSLEADSVESPKNLTVRLQDEGDSNQLADIILNKETKRKFGLFSLDTTKEKDVETLLLYKDSTLIGRQFLQVRDIPQNVFVRLDTLNLDPGGYNSWEITMPDNMRYYTSISICDSDRSIPAPISITSLHHSYTEDLTTPLKLIDTNYVGLTGKATRLSGKSIKDEQCHEMLVAGVQDSSFLFTRVVPIDANGNFSLDSLSFTGDLTLQFQMNKAADGSTKDLRLNVNRPPAPSIGVRAFLSGWEDDQIQVDGRDTNYTAKELNAFRMSKIKMLQAAIVKGRKDVRKELDKIYTSGPFSEPAVYFYDLREYSSNYNRSIFSYLSTQPGRLSYDPVQDTLKDIFKHPIHYYVDETQYDHSSLNMFDFDRIAYIKILESDFLPTFTTLDELESGQLRRSGKIKTMFDTAQIHKPVDQTPVNVLIYTRKGKDFRTMPGGLNTAYIKGYDKALPFSPDRKTLYWSSEEEGHIFRVRFRNNDQYRGFRIRVSGITAAGKIAYCERTISIGDMVAHPGMAQASGKQRTNPHSTSSTDLGTVGNDGDAHY